MKKSNDEKKYDYDAVLLKIHRMYSKDESIAYLFKEISDLKFQIGILKSENDELTDLLAKKPQIKEEVVVVQKIKEQVIVVKKKVEKEWTKEEYAKGLLNQIAELKKKCLVNKGVEWQKKYFDIFAKYNKLIETSK